MNIDTDKKRRLREQELREEQEAERALREEAKKNRNFVQLYRNNLPELRWLILESGIATRILFFIMEHMDNKNALVCSYAIFEEHFGISKPTITRAIKLLKDNGFIDTLKVGTSNVYIMNHEVSWSSWENQKQYSLFNGKVLVSRKENKDYDARNQIERFKALRQNETLKKWRKKAVEMGLKKEDEEENIKVWGYTED